MGMWWRADRPGDSSSSCKGRVFSLSSFIPLILFCLCIHPQSLSLFPLFLLLRLLVGRGGGGGLLRGPSTHTHEKGRGKTGPPAVWGGERKRRMKYKKRNRMNRWKWWREGGRSTAKKGNGRRCAMRSRGRNIITRRRNFQSRVHFEKNIQRIRINLLKKSIKYSIESKFNSIKFKNNSLLFQ